jgi:hypothetical protein
MKNKNVVPVSTMSFRMQGASIPVIQAVEAPKPAEPTPAQLQKQVMDLSAQLDALKKQVSSGSLKPALAVPGLAVPVVSHVARSPAASPRYGSRP